MESKHNKIVHFILGIGFMILSAVLIASKVIKYFIVVGFSFLLMILTNGGASKNSSGHTFFIINKTLTITSFVTLCIMIALVINNDMINKSELHKMVSTIVQTRETIADKEIRCKDNIIYNKLKRNQVKKESLASKIPLLNTIKKNGFQICSASVKKVGEKYRYYFNIKKNGIKSNDNQIKLTLHSANGESNRVEIFNSKKGSQQNNNIFIELNSGTVDTHGEFGINHFDYQVLENNKIIDNGEGKITNNILDL